MFKGIAKRLVLLIAIVLCAQLTFPSSVQSAPEDSIQVKELNFVFLHGVGGTTCSTQLLSDYITELLPAFVFDYEQANPNTKVQVSTLQRCYPAYVDIDTWAKNIADSIDQHFPDKKNLILIGHSMGGKTALYAIAQNIGGLANKVALVITINSPVKSLDRYFIAGGGSVEQYCQAGWLLFDEGVCNSVTYYNSSLDGRWVGRNKHWLAFISGELAPLSKQFDRAGVDAWPRDMDDGIVPLSAQYSEGADVVYYGEHGHSDFTVLDDVAEFMSEQILRYIFGGLIECSVFVRGGTFQHKADWLLGTDYWEDVVGEIPVSGGSLRHTNESYTEWREWEDTLGDCSPRGERSSYLVSRVSLPLFFTSIQESRWLSPDDPEDCRLYIRTRAAPRNTVQVEWSINQKGLLPSGTERSHYEVEITEGTLLTGIRGGVWETDNPADLRLLVFSEAQSPFRWYRAKWRVYSKEGRQRQVINEIPAEAFLSAN